MSRDVYFKGLRIDGKGWVFGLLNQYQGKLFITNEVIEHPTFTDPAGSWIYHENEIIPESVGQFTGLKDKNGIDIYEFDYVLDKHNKRILVEYEFSLLSRLKEIEKELLLDGNLYK